MLIEVKVPQLSESVSDATLIAWHKKVGEFVERGDNLVDIETDKVVLETPAPEAGILTAIHKSDGSAVTSKEIIATIETEAKKEEKPALTPAFAVVPPSARRAATENDVDISKVKGSGRGGRVTKSDVVKAAASASAYAKQAQQTAMPASALPRQMPAFDASANRPEQRVPMTRLRARIAERLVESQHAAAILTTFNEVNMQPVMDLRNRYKEKFQEEHGVKLGFMSFFVKAVVIALKEFPIVNASIDGNDIVYHGYYDIGIAIGSERGLVVPILRDADKLTFAQTEKQIADYAARAQDGHLTIEELTGGTFSISNGGVFGSMLSTPIINPPQAGILGVHATKERPVVENGQIVIRPMNYFALSYDHRMIDGREAVLFLVAIKEALEEPARLLLEI